MKINADNLNINLRHIRALHSIAQQGTFSAAAASLGMIPIAREVFWGPMAYAMIGGIIIATLLTLLFLPALYVAWYKIREPKQEHQPQQD